MTIHNTDLKLLAAEQNNDTDSGGGNPSAVEILDGQANALFNDISRLDRTHGKVSLRKTFMSVQTPGTEPLLGAHVILSQRAADPAVSVAMFSTGSLSDMRAAARNRMESYVALGARSRWELYGDHLSGARHLILYGGYSLATPEIGSVMALVSSSKTAWVKITSIVGRVYQEFHVSNGSGGTRTFARDILTLSISAPLADDFFADAVTDLVLSNPKTAIHGTLTGSSTVYYGCMATSVAPTLGATQVTVGELYAQIVPTADTQTLIANWSPYSAGTTVGTAKKDVTSQNRSYSWAHTVGAAILAGSATVEYRVFGKWIRLVDNGAGALSGATGQGGGAIDYANGAMTVTVGALPDAGSVVLFTWRLATGNQSAAPVHFIIPGAPLLPGSVTIAGLDIGITPSYDYATGLATLTVTGLNGEQIHYDHAITLSAVAVGQTALDASRIGIDPTRMPSDGRVPLVQAGQSVVIHHTADTALPTGLTSGQVCALPRNNLAWAELVDALGARVAEDRYTLNAGAGTITWNNPINLAGLVEPIMARHRIEEMRLVTDVQFTGEMTLARALARSFPADTQVSTVLEFGDLQTRISRMFHQATWASIWSDSASGNAPAANYNDAIAPIELSNVGAVTQRWALVFANASSFTILGEELGVIGTGNIAADCAPLNPATGAAYFRIKAAGWGAGWAAGNVLRFDTGGMIAPIWLVRTTQIDPTSFGDDDFRIELRGDAQ